MFTLLAPPVCAHVRTVAHRSPPLTLHVCRCCGQLARVDLDPAAETLLNATAPLAEELHREGAARLRDDAERMVL